MKIEKGIKIGESVSKKVEYNANFFREFISVAEVTDSVLVECSQSQSQSARSILDRVVKDDKVVMKFSLRKWDENHYRLWRVS